jgi:uncharacterized protein
MDVLLAALGIMLIFEGVPWFLGPERVKGLLRQILTVDNGILRGLGLLLMVTGLLVVYLALGLGDKN